MTATRRLRSAWLLAIVVLAAALRLYPIWFGLPYAHARPDEETALGHAFDIMRGDLNPRFFHWPSLTFYVFAALFRVVSLGRDLSAADATLWARGLVALTGTATVFLVHRIGRRVAGEAVGLLAALFLAVALLHVREAHFAMTDVLMTFFVTLALAVLLRAIDEPASWLFAAAGAAGGFAASTKYSAAAVFAAMAAVQILLIVSGRVRPWSPRAWLPSALFTTAFAMAFIAGTPYALLDYPRFREDLLFDFTHLSGGHAGVNLGRGWAYHLTRSLPVGCGLGIFVAAVAGVVPAVRHYPRRALVPAAFFVATYLVLGSGTTVFFRYILPLVPVACLFAALAVRHVAVWVATHTPLTLRTATTALLLITAAPALVSCLWMDVLLARTDTRVLAARWLEERLRPEDTLHDAGNGYTQLPLGHIRFHNLRYDTAVGAFEGAGGRTPDWIVLYQSPVRAYVWAPTALRTLAATKYTLAHAVTASRDSDGAWPFLLPRPIYDLQDAFFLPLSGFQTVARPGPTVLIYRRN